MTHILWDFSKDGVEPDIDLVKNVYDYLKEKKLEPGMVSPTYFLSGSHKGSFSSYDKNIRVHSYLMWSDFYKLLKYKKKEKIDS